MAPILSRPCTRHWLLLLALTFVTFAAAQAGLKSNHLILAVLLLAIIKGNIIVDRFMGLSTVRGLWRPLLWLYLAIVGLCIYVAFLLPSH